MNLLLHTVFLCTANVVFMLTGILLNSTVILCFWKSSQLRNKLDYFMILVLACFDLAVVIITHPLIFLSTVAWYIRKYEVFHTVNLNVSAFFYGSSFVSLLTMNIERYTALYYPFFHQRFVTRWRIIALLVSLEVLGLVQFILSFRDLVLPAEVAPASFLGILFFMLFFLNYKIFMIARRIRKEDNRIVASLRQNQEDRRGPGQSSDSQSELTLKSVSTCLFAVVCFFLCCFPGLLYNCINLVSKYLLHPDIIFAWGLWASTFVSMNSTFNCLIFFWKNTTLQNEGRSLLKQLKFFIMTAPKVDNQRDCSVKEDIRGIDETAL